MFNKHHDSGEKIRKAFYEDGHVLASAIDKISDFRGEVVEKLGFAPIFVVQQKTERFMPRIDLFDSGGAFQVDIELPGISIDELNVIATSDWIRVTGNRGKHTDDRKILFLEQLDGHFSRTLHFDGQIDGESCKARLTRGVLHLTLQKADSDTSDTEEFSITVEE